MERVKMETNLTKIIVENGQETIVPLTKEELELRDRDIAEYQERLKQDEIIAANKAALLAKLGITADEAKLLLN
jgi:hypothetical protein